MSKILELCGHSYEYRIVRKSLKTELYLLEIKYVFNKMEDWRVVELAFQMEYGVKSSVIKFGTFSSISELIKTFSMLKLDKINAISISTQPVYKSVVVLESENFYDDFPEYQI